MLHNTAWAACYRNADHFAISCMHALLQSRMLVIMFHEQVVSFRHKLSVFEDCLRILIARAMLEKYFELWCLMLYTKDALHCASSCYYWQSMLRCRHGKLQKFERVDFFNFQSCSWSSLRVKTCKILLCGWQCLTYLGDITTLCSCKRMFNFDDAVHTWSPVAEFFNVGLFSWFCMCGYYRIELIAMRIVFVHCFHCTSILHASCSLVDLVAMYVLKN